MELSRFNSMGAPVEPLHDQARRTAAIHVGPVPGPGQEQPRVRFPIQVPVAVAGLPAVDGHQVKVMPILGQPKDRARVDTVGESALVVDVAVADVDPVGQDRVQAAHTGVSAGR